MAETGTKTKKPAPRTKAKRISDELYKMRKLFRKIPDNQRALCDGLIQNAAFMAVTLRELQADITRYGAVVPCQSGNGFDTIKDNPSQKAYTTMIARYSSIIGQLMALLPPEQVDEDPLAEFRDM